MGLLENLHKERKARLERFKKAAVTDKPPPVQIHKLPPKSSQEVIKYLLLDLGPWSKFDFIVESVCDFYQVRKIDLLSRRRFSDLAEKRHILTYMLQAMTKMTRGQIARLMKRDLTTVRHSIVRIENNIDNYLPTIRALEEYIKRR